MHHAFVGRAGTDVVERCVRLGGWVRWIGCAAVWEAGRAVCGERHLEQTQGYALTGPRPFQTDTVTGSTGIFIPTGLATADEHQVLRQI